MTGKLEAKTAIVTGASSGIGEAIAIRFAEEGASVIVSSRSMARCEDVTDSILRNGHKAKSIVCDVTKEHDIAKLFDATVTEFGDINIVVANAGISGGTRTIEEYELEDWRRVLDTNLTGVFLTVREAFRRFKGNGGHIIVMSSQAGIFGYARKGPYCAAKFGVRGLAHSLAEEGRENGIVVSTICPGTVDTPILAATNTQIRNPISPSAIADTAVFLASQGGNSMIRDVLVERMRLG